MHVCIILSFGWSRLLYCVSVSVGILSNHLSPSFFDCSRGTLETWCNFGIYIGKLWVISFAFESLRRKDWQGHFNDCSRKFLIRLRNYDSWNFLMCQTCWEIFSTETGIKTEEPPFNKYIWSSDKLFRNHDFFSEKIIVGPQEVETPPLLAQMVLTQCISISELLVHHMAPPGGQI